MGKSGRAGDWLRVAKITPWGIRLIAGAGRFIRTRDVDEFQSKPKLSHEFSPGKQASDILVNKLRVRTMK